MRTDLVLDALRMALAPARRRAPTSSSSTTPTAAAQYTSIDYTQTLADHGVLASVGSVGDAYDNALAESFVDSFKTELIADRVWRTRSPARARRSSSTSAGSTRTRLHESLDDRPPVEFEQQHALEEATTFTGTMV